MLNFVPFAGPRRKVTNAQPEPRFVRESLQFQFPEPQPRTIASATVRSNQDRFRVRIQPPPLVPPPSPDRRHGESPSVMVGAHIDEPYIAPHVVDPIGIGTGNLRLGKIMTLDFERLFFWEPLLAGIVVVAHQFFLFRVH